MVALACFFCNVRPYGSPSLARRGGTPIGIVRCNMGRCRAGLFLIGLGTVIFGLFASR